MSDYVHSTVLLILAILGKVFTYVVDNPVIQDFIEIRQVDQKCLS